MTPAEALSVFELVDHHPYVAEHELAEARTVLRAELARLQAVRRDLDRLRTDPDSAVQNVVVRLDAIMNR